MPDYGRYDDDLTRDRSGRSRDRDSIFGSGRDARGRDDHDRAYRDNQPGGWIGSGATSDYDRIERDRYRSRGSGRDGGGFVSRDRDRGAQGWRSSRDGDWSTDRRGGGERFERDRGYGRDDYNDDLPHNETSRLIASNKVEGTPVYNRRGDRLGTIYNFMVDKFSGKVEYAVMTYGGFLGIGQRYYPLPWRMLDYDTREGGYVVDMSERDLEDAPSFGRGDEPRFNRDYGRHVHSWYGLQY
ncbi:MAG: PRC-barrel domain-containing protein [Allosphingosinicella sp.]|uniref:PRC-barrel domain-containing protein n=1 Tax=Allosphingosinicella sp. TaxID=2823234 RepID=UPI00392C2346